MMISLHWGRPMQIMVIFVSFVLMSTSPVRSQNLYDLQHSRQFAEYLFQGGEYAHAAEEYERVLFLDPQHAETQLRLVQAYRFGGNLDLAKKRLLAFQQSQANLRPTLASEFVRTLWLRQEYPEAHSFLEQPSSFSPQARTYYQVGTELLLGNYGASDTLLRREVMKDHPAYQQLYTLSQSGLNLKRKSPALSVGLSAVVPGLGKAYSGYWKDGLFSLLFTGVAAWQSYRGFSKQGIESPIGWIFAGIGSGFYLGNLYGSAKAAKRKNQQRQHDLQHEIERQLFRP